MLRDRRKHTNKARTKQEQSKNKARTKENTRVILKYEEREERNEEHEEH